MKNIKLTNIVDALALPAIAMDFNLDILCANKDAKQLFDDELEHQNLLQHIQNSDINTCLDRAKKTKILQSIDVTLNLHTSRTYEVSCAVLVSETPLKPSHDDEGTILFTLNDISAELDAEKSRSIFVANVSHELRSPLTSLMGIVETLKGPARNDEKARDRFLDLMQSETSRMSRLVGDLLSLSKLEAQEHLAPDGEVNIKDLIQSVTTVLAESTPAYKNRVIVHAQRNLPILIGDPDELTEVFQNLIENALKYSTPGSPVDITITHMNAKVSLGIKDQGEGIAPKHLPRLTERFYRADKGRSRDMGGTGLGLAITKHILNRHRAQFTIESELGVGTHVIVAFQ